MLNSPQIQQQKQAVVDLETQKNALNEQIYNLDTQVRSVLGSEAPESLVTAYIAEQTKNLDSKVRTIDNNLTTEQATLKNQLDEITSTLDYVKTGFSADQTNANKKATGTGT